MISAEIRVNGTLVGVIDVINTGQPAPSLTGDTTLYDFVLIDHTTGMFGKGRVAHKRSDPFAILFHKVLEQATADPA